MQLSRLLALLLAVGSATAIPALSELNRRQTRAVEDAMSSIIDSLKSYDTIILALRNTDSSGPVLRATEDIESTISSSIRSVEEARKANVFTSVALIQVSNNMVDQVQTTIRDLRNKKSVMDRIGTSKVTLDTLQKLRPATRELADAIGDKVPDLGRDIVDKVKSDILDALNQAISTYSQPAAAPAAPVPPPAASPSPAPSPNPGAPPPPPAAPPAVVTVTTVVPPPTVVTVTAVAPQPPSVVTVTATATPSPEFLDG
ncbi:hypothetical protein MCOR25_004657 [Pyricularia grisea]|uniref:Cell wall protein n=1 Tax=Pyricularia grisea TaxID=148305 RepID=A0A6P8BHR5_PYRGI|nr:uncharacterized protein PgNI_01876 [Pyricularia grisea]KAI6368360.1 hypothetical protein MCOR25_004657 [Pyricularia grisea]TLD16421.1 hypothetical protein PgNI_01876 [Pyricularia grisea]